MDANNAGWWPALGGRAKAVPSEPERYHQSHDRSQRRERDPEPEGTGDRPIPAVAEPRTRTLDIEEKSAYIPDRRLVINGTEIDADRTMTVRADDTGAAMADIEIYNMDVRTWKGIDETDDIEIRLGWNQTATPPVFTGSVVTKGRGWRGNDRRFVIRALADGGRVLKRNDYSRTFNDLAPHRIVAYMIDDLPIGRGYVSTLSGRIDGYYAISRHKTVAEWLDDLAQKAATQTGRNWVWYIENGELNFHPTVERTTQPITLSTEKSLLRATPTGRPRGGQNHPYELAMYCEPVIHRGLSVELEGVAEVSSGRRYRVKSYVTESSTVTQRHHTTATVTPLVERSEVYEDQ